MAHPVIAAGHTCERAAVEQWLAHHATKHTNPKALVLSHPPGALSKGPLLRNVCVHLRGYGCLATAGNANIGILWTVYMSQSGILKLGPQGPR